MSIYRHPCEFNFKRSPLPQPPHHGNNAPWDNAPCMVKNKIKTKTKPSHVTFKFATRSIGRISPQIIEWLDESQP